MKGTEMVAAVSATVEQAAAASNKLAVAKSPAVLMEAGRQLPQKHSGGPVTVATNRSNILDAAKQQQHSVQGPA